MNRIVVFPSKGSHRILNGCDKLYCCDINNINNLHLCYRLVRLYCDFLFLVI